MVQRFVFCKGMACWWQWRSQDIAVARAQHGHTTFVRTSARSAETYRGSGGILPPPPPPPPRILQPPRSVLRPFTVAKCKSLMAKLAYDHLALDSRSTTLLSVLHRWGTASSCWGTACSCWGTCPSVPQRAPAWLRHWLVAT